MISHFIKFFKGYVRIRISGNSIERFINLCRLQKIKLWELQSHNGRYELCLSISDFKKIRSIKRKTGVHIQIIEKYGLPFVIHTFVHRKLFFLGAGMFVLLIYFCCNTIWQIDISGNQFYTDNVLRRYLTKQSIRVGMRSNEVDCSEIVRLLRNQYEEIVWVSASLKGSLLHIQLKENTQREDSSVTSLPDIDLPMDLIASKSGRIKEIITRQGIPLVHEGDEVVAGQKLVSGYIPIKNDSDEIIAYQTVQADADIYASTEYSYHNNLPHEYIKKQYQSPKQYQFSIHMRDSFFLIAPIKHQKAQETFSKQIRFSCFDTFAIPLSITMKSTTNYQDHKKKHSKKEVQTILSAHFHQFCLDLEKKGVQIVSNSVKIYSGVSASKAEGTLETVEKIGILRYSDTPETENERILN